MFIRFVLQEIYLFLRNVWGSIQRPYATYRQLVGQDPVSLSVIFILIGIYFFVVSPIKLHTFHPFLLTLNASRLLSMTITTFFFIILFFACMAKLFRKEVNLSAISNAWGYSLVPTLLWFFTTSIFYLLLPPPRHETLPGRIFSVLFFAFSISLFFWKGLLYYLTMRFALKFDLLRIIGVSFVFFPLLALYSWWMYTLGVFRVPFV